MELIKVDVVRLETFEAALDRFLDRSWANRGAAPDPLEAIANDLGRDDDVIALSPAVEPCTYDLFGAALRFFRQWRRRVHLGCIDEVDALSDGVVELRMAVSLGVLAAPGHAAETNLADFDIGAS